MLEDFIGSPKILFSFQKRPNLKLYVKSFAEIGIQDHFISVARKNLESM